MNRYEVMLYPKAYRDIDDIYAYLAIVKMSPENAKTQTDQIWDELDKPDTFSSSHQDRLEGRYAGKGYKQIIIDNYIAVFKIDESQNRVYVVTVQYHGFNMANSCKCS